MKTGKTRSLKKLASGPCVAFLALSMTFGVSAVRADSETSMPSLQEMFLSPIMDVVHAVSELLVELLNSVSKLASNSGNLLLSFGKCHQLENMSMNRYLIVSGFVFAFSLVSSAQAQVVLDVTKITCDQFVHHKLLEPRLIAAWLSGYYHGKRDTQVIDLEKFDENLSKLEGFCYQEKNFKLPVMQAVEEVIGTGK
jgi:hypothetical protein